MNRNQFLAKGSPASEFSIWLGEIIAGDQPLDFRNKKGKWNHLSDCLKSYSWPARNNAGPLLVETDWQFPEGAIFEIKADAGLKENNKVLNDLSTGLRGALADGQDAAPWVAAILVWGGVYHQRGGHNQKWVHANLKNLNSILCETRNALLHDTDDIVIPNLRFNSGLTKVYSLIIDGFVIYDSRVAAALAWLVHKRFGTEIPASLRFPCMPAASAALCRNPLPGRHGFPVLGARPALHAKWNQRANWLLSEAFALALETTPIATHTYRDLRDVEAALFVMGYDLSESLA